MITDVDPDRFMTRSLRDPRILRILATAVDAVDPFKAVQAYLPALEGRVFGLAIGKAAVPMMDALAESVPLAGGLAATKFAPEPARAAYVVLEADHPLPSARSVQAGERVLEFVSSLTDDDTLVCLISGGGSALVTAPCVPLEDLQTLTSLLLASGAPIDEMNILRRQLDRIKGGGLARATRAKVISLILSDVIGNPLEAIASGPTVPDPTTRRDACAILEKYDLRSRAPDSVLGVLESDSPDSAGELSPAENIIVGDNRLAALAAGEQARQEGFQTEILTDALQGEAAEMGRELAARLRTESAARQRPFCLIAGGETTVTLRGQGRGGRNQELALAAVPELAGLEGVVLVALATDGDDGPTDAAGAVVTGDSDGRARELGLDAAAHLARNDAYPFFEGLGDLLKTGPSGTNVNDLVFLCAF